MSGELPATAPSSEELSGAELAARAGVGEQEIQRLVTHGVLVPRQGPGAPFRAVDLLKIRMARACEEGGLPMAGMTKAIRAGHLSFAFVESWPFEPWAARGPWTHAELATEVGLPLESLQRIVEAFGFARPEPGDAVVAALDMVEDVPAAGLPPARVGVAAGPVIRQGGDYFGRTVNLASRIADHARGGQVLVSEPVVAMTSVAGVRFDGMGAIALPGLRSPVNLFESR